MWNSEKRRLYYVAILAAGLPQLNPNFIWNFRVQKFASSSAGYYSANMHAIKVKLGGFLVISLL